MGWGVVRSHLGGRRDSVADAFFEVVEVSGSLRTSSVERGDYRCWTVVAAIAIGRRGGGLGTRCVWFRRVRPIIFVWLAETRREWLSYAACMMMVRVRRRRMVATPSRRRRRVIRHVIRIVIVLLGRRRWRIRVPRMRPVRMLRRWRRVSPRVGHARRLSIVPVVVRVPQWHWHPVHVVVVATVVRTALWSGRRRRAGSLWRCSIFVVQFTPLLKSAFLRIILCGCGGCARHDGKLRQIDKVNEGAEDVNRNASHSDAKK